MITKEQAIELGNSYRKEFYIYDWNGRISRVRVNGKCQTWKTRPDEFRLPIKYGLRECGEIEKHSAWRAFLSLDDCKREYPYAPVQKGI